MALWRYGSIVLVLGCGCYQSFEIEDETTGPTDDAGMDDGVANPRPSEPLSGEQWCRADGFILISAQSLEASHIYPPRLHIETISALCIPDDVPMVDGVLACRLVQILPDDRPCPYPAQVDGGGAHVGGLHVDLGLNDDGLRECEILPGEPGDSCLTLECPCPVESSADIPTPGWWYTPDTFMCSGEFSVGPAIAFAPAQCLPLWNSDSYLRFDCSYESCPVEEGS